MPATGGRFGLVEYQGFFFDLAAAESFDLLSLGWGYALLLAQPLTNERRGATKHVGQLRLAASAKAFYVVGENRMFAGYCISDPLKLAFVCVEDGLHGSLRVYLEPLAMQPEPCDPLMRQLFYGKGVLEFVVPVQADLNGASGLEVLKPEDRINGYADLRRNQVGGMEDINGCHATSPNSSGQRSAFFTLPPDMRSIFRAIFPLTGRLPLSHCQTRPGLHSRADARTTCPPRPKLSTYSLRVIVSMGRNTSIAVYEDQQRRSLRRY